MDTSILGLENNQVAEEKPWQLLMFNRSLKKQQKLAAILRVLGDLSTQECLCVTCGDNNGALNWHLSRHGGEWSWADAEPESIRQISALSGEPVTIFSKDEPALAYEDGKFDVVVTIDVHEHLPQPFLLNAELARIIRPGGKVIVTTPGGEQHRLANRFKRWMGMHQTDYGHFVDGYNRQELEQQLDKVGLRPVTYDSYSRFFTEMVELLINFAFVKVLSRRSSARIEPGQIAPQSSEQLKSVEKSYRLYSTVYPLFWLISRLDYLLLFTDGYAPVVRAERRT